MYDRILGKISGARQQQYAKDILMWLAYARRPLCLQEIDWATAFSLDENSEVTINPKKRLQNAAAEMFDICHSLVGLIDDPVRFVGSQQVELAHSTVKDHITSTRQGSSSSWLGVLQSELSHRFIAQSLLAYLRYLSQYPWDDKQTARWSREFSLAWYAVHVWPEHATLGGASLDNLHPMSTLHRQMARLMSNTSVLKGLIRLFEPHKARDYQLLDKALQDLKLVWYYTSRMRLGRMIQISVPPKTHMQTLAPGSYRTMETHWTVGQKLGGAGEMHESHRRQGGWMQHRNWGDLTLRELIQDQDEDWKLRQFLDVGFTLWPRKLRGGETTSFWDDSDLAVAVVKFDCPDRLPLECQLPMVIHVPFSEKVQQAPALGKGDPRKPAKP